MRSENGQVWVWNWLPGHDGPVLAGLFELGVEPGGRRLGRFRYAQTYLDHPGRLPIDPVLLPLRPAEFKTTDLEGIFGVLRDAGPDAWGKFLIDRLHGPQDELGYLLHAHGGRTGSIDFSASRDIPPAPPRMLTSFQNLAIAALAVRVIISAKGAGEPIPDDLREVLDAGTSNGGARPKFTVALEGRTWIAKFPAKDDHAALPPMPLQECAALTLAQRCGIRVPEHRLVDVKGVPVLLVERFDRVGAQRLSYASARTVLWSNPEVQRWSYMGSYNNFSRQMGPWIRTPDEDRHELYRRVVFNALTGNQDDHDQNHGLVFDPEIASYRLAPMFDPVDSTVRPVRSLAMAFGDDAGTISIDNLLSNPESFGMDKGACDAALRFIAVQIAGRWRAELRQLGAAEPQIDAMAYRFAIAESFVRANVTSAHRDDISAEELATGPGAP